MPIVEHLDPVARLCDAWDRGIEPDQLLTVSEWAAAHRVLSSKSGAGQGDWDNGVTPYLVIPMDCMSAHHPCRLVAMQGPSQFGKTDGLINNVIGYRIDVAPTACVVIQPTVDMGKQYVTQKLDPMLEGTPRLIGKVAQKKSREPGNTALFKDFAGGMVVIGGANSPTRLRQTSAGLVIGDDIDAFPKSAGKEGDPWELLRRRQQSYEYFGRPKALAVSSPGNEPSRIVQLVTSCERVRIWTVPCPYCNGDLILKRGRLVYEKPERYEDVGEVLPDVRYVCDLCEREIEERWQHPMIDAGKYLTVKDRPSPLSEGFRLPGLCARFRAWGATAASEWKAELSGDAEQKKIVINTMYGEDFSEPSAAPPWQPLYDRREPYPFGVIPVGGLLLTAGADVQADRIEVELVAWGHRMRSWSVAVLIIPGDVNKPELWWALDDVMADTYPTAWGTRIPIVCMGIDSGYSSADVYRWANGLGVRRDGKRRRKYRTPDFARNAIAVRHPRTVMVCKGTDWWDKLLRFSAKADAAEERRGLKLVHIGASHAKEELYNWLRHEIPADGVDEPAGFCHWPEDDRYDADHFQQLTAETIEYFMHAGVRRRRFVLPAHARNERLDCRVLARAAAAAIGADRFTPDDWARLARRLNVPGDAVPYKPRRPAGAPPPSSPIVPPSTPIAAAPAPPEPPPAPKAPPAAPPPPSIEDELRFRPNPGLERMRRESLLSTRPSTSGMQSSWFRR